MQPVLSLEGVTIGYPGHLVLQGVSFAMTPGEAVAVLGPNGSGKTAFLKTVAGILPPLSGRVRLGRASGSEALHVGYVPQRATVSGLLPLTVCEVVEMGTYGWLKPWERVGAAERARIAWAMDRVGVTGLGGKRYATLSGGQQQRVLIARALATHPAVLVLDEPLASLDRESVQAMIALLATLKSERRLTILWADHFVPALREVVEDVLLIENAGLVRNRIEVLLDRERSLLMAREAAPS